MPHRFTDAAGRDWLIAIDYTTAKAVKVATGINLFEISDGSIFAKLAADPFILADLLFVVCREQAKARGVDDAEFGKGLAGDSIEAATDALIGAIVDFFPKGRRDLLAAVAEKVKDVNNRATAKAMAAINGPAMNDMIAEALSAPLTNSPELPELTPVHSHSEK